MTIGMARVAATVALLYAARRYYRNWGTTKEESQSWLPGDEMVRPPSVRSTEGIWIEAPAAAIWPWLVQIGHRNADRIHPEWQRLARGDVVHLAPRGWLGLRDGVTMSVAQVIDGETIVLRGTPPGFAWDAVWSFHVQPRWEDRCRLLVRTRAQLRRPGDVLLTELAGPVTALLVRRMLLGIKGRAQRSLQTEDLHHVG